MRALQDQFKIKGWVLICIGIRSDEREFLPLPEKQPFSAQLDPGPQI